MRTACARREELLNSPLKRNSSPGWRARTDLASVIWECPARCGIKTDRSSMNGGAHCESPGPKKTSWKFAQRARTAFLALRMTSSPFIHLCQALGNSGAFSPRFFHRDHGPRAGWARHFGGVVSTAWPGRHAPQPGRGPSPSSPQQGMQRFQAAAPAQQKPGGMSPAPPGGNGVRMQTFGRWHGGVSACERG
jgi:hypothetical protein